MKILSALFLSVLAGLAAVPPIELRDQFDQPQTLSFPTARFTILTVADRKGNDQVDGWIAALKSHYAARADFRGIADVRGVPSFLQGHIRKKFQESRRYPVMMDWTGETSKRLDAKSDVANVLVLDRSGGIAARFSGKATREALSEAMAALDKALKNQNE